MECLNSENCKNNTLAYFCVMKNDFVLNDEVPSVVVEKNRIGWKKGDPNYEIHRRKTRKESEVWILGIESTFYPFSCRVWENTIYDKLYDEGE